MQAHSHRCQRLCASVGLIVGLLACWTAPTQAVTLIPESNFEGSGPTADGWGYTASYCASSPCAWLDVSSDIAFSGSKSLKLTYDEAWNNPAINTVGIFYKFPSQTDIYVRYWKRTAAGFIYNTPGTKQIIYDSGVYPRFLSIHDNSSRALGMGVENPADCGYTTCTLRPNIAHINMSDNQWYCVEEHVKLNDVGAANGLVEIWINGTLTNGFYNRTWRGPNAVNPNGNSSTASISTISIYKHKGNGLLYIDQFMAATTRIGCGGRPGGDTTPPKSPANFTVR